MNNDIAPAPSGTKRLALFIWLTLAIAGSVAVWWVSSYLDDVTTLARTDREAAVALFKSRVLPVFVVTAIAAVAGGVLMVRQGIRIVRAGEFPPEGMRLMRDTPRMQGSAARAIGWLLTITGVLMAGVPLAILVITLWLIRRQ